MGAVQCTGVYVRATAVNRSALHRTHTQTYHLPLPRHEPFPLATYRLNIY